jgi:hypothetical protein
MKHSRRQNQNMADPPKVVNNSELVLSVGMATADSLSEDHL